MSVFVHTVGNDKPQRRGSVGSLDSGMSISFQSIATSNTSRDNNNVIAPQYVPMKMRYCSTPSSAVASVHHVPIGNINIATGNVAFKQHSADTVPVESTTNCVRMATRENKYTQQHQHQHQQQQQQQPLQQRTDNIQERSTEV